MFLYRLITRLITFFTDRRPAYDQELLLQLVSAATDHDLPPSGIIKAHANDCGWRERARLRALACRLDTGSSLGDAIELTPGILPDRSLLSVRFGSEQGTLKESLAARTNVEDDRQTEAAIEKIVDAFSYGVTMSITALFIGLFCMAKAAPPLRVIYLKLATAGQTMVSSWSPIEGVEIPWAMRTLARMADSSAPLLAGALLGILIAVWWIASGRMNRALRTGWIARLMRTQHLTVEASALEQLAIAKDAGRPLVPALDTLARNHPHPSLASRLREARDESADRPSVWSALSSVQLIGAAESKALVLSESLSNTAWVLRQFAQRRRNDAATRLQVLAQFVMPGFILLFAAITFFLAMALLVPIFQATQLIK